jgi:hypothetical protein
MDIKQLIANALTMAEGDCVVIPTLGDKEAESIRTRLYKVRDNHPTAKQLIQIKRRSIHLGPPIIYLDRTGPPVQIPEFKPLSIEDTPDIRRMVKVAIEDGYDLEWIVEHFSSLAHKDKLANLFVEESLIFKQLAGVTNA